MRIRYFHVSVPSCADSTPGCNSLRRANCHCETLCRSRRKFSQSVNQLDWLCEILSTTQSCRYRSKTADADPFPIPAENPSRSLGRFASVVLVPPVFPAAFFDGTSGSIYRCKIADSALFRRFVQCARRTPGRYLPGLNNTVWRCCTYAGMHRCSISAG